MNELKVRIMKKFVLLALVAMIGMGAMVSSCSKDEAADSPKASDKISMKDQLILNKIFKFRDRILELQTNPSIKSSEATTVDSAVWYLDATLNLSHSFISWETMKAFHTDSVFITIPKSGTEITYAELAAAYAELKEKVKQKVLAAPGEDKELYMASLSKKEETDDDITIKSNVTVGEKGLAPGSENPFRTDWYYGDLLGDANGNYLGSKDACTELRDWTNYYKSMYLGNGFYISSINDDPYVTIASENPYFINGMDPNPGDNEYERYLLYQTQSGGYIDIIPKDHLNWYYHQLNNLVYNVIPNDQQEFPNAYGKTLVQVMNEYDPQTGEGTAGTKDFALNIIRHQFKLEYRGFTPVGESNKPQSIKK